MEEITFEENELSPTSFWPRIKEKFQLAKTRVVEWWRARNKFQKAGIILGGLLVLSVIIFVVVRIRLSATEDFHFFTTPTPSDLPIVPPEEPKDHMAPLDGVLMTKTDYEAMMQRWPLAIIIENNIAARNYQTGLNQADLVYEVLVEGGITRFMPIFLRQDAEKVSPVRSMRAYFLDWVSEFPEVVVMHIGTAGPPNVNPEADALTKMLQYQTKTLSPGGSQKWWWRYPEIKLTYLREHSAYTATEALWEEAENRGWCCQALEIETWNFKEDAREEDRPSEGEVKFSWGGWGNNGYQVRWGYDVNDNVYRREHGGAQAIDAQTNEQIWAKNLVVQFTKVTLANDVKHHLLYETIGEGRALVFRDGYSVEGTWKKPERTSRTIFYDDEGNEVEFNRGRTWISVVPLETEVSYF